MRLLDFVSAFRLPPANVSDFGILKVAFLVAAVDGKITDEELHVYELMSRRCRGYTKKRATDALEEAVQTAGNLILKTDSLSEKDFVSAFVAAADSALPDGFFNFSVVDIRRAIVTWVVMGMSDGDYSRRERLCIEALRSRFAERKAQKLRQRAAESGSLSAAYDTAFVVQDEESGEVSDRFVDEVVAIINRLGDTAEAEAALKDLIAHK